MSDRPPNQPPRPPRPPRPPGASGFPGEEAGGPERPRPPGRRPEGSGRVPPERSLAPTGQGRRDVDPFDYERIFAEDDEIAGVSWRDRLGTNRRRLRRWGIAVAVLLVLLLLGNVAKAQVDPSGPVGAEINLTVPKGASTASIAALLEKNGVVPSALGFRLWAKYKGESNFQAGEYLFHKNESAGAALAVLKSGPKQRIDKITIPEGFTINQVAERVARIAGFSGQKFFDLAMSNQVRSEYQPIEAKTPEGFLFPNTYLLSGTDNEETLLRQMINQFDAQAGAVGLDEAERSRGRSAYDILKIASMVESEAKIDADRAKIAQVIENRLAADMRLQIDATVIYALGAHKSALTKRDLEVDSPYNTYKVKGLPPTPISNPGIKSIRAALRPEPGPWLYYVVTGADGSHSFARTLAEHERNIELGKSRGVLN